MGWFNAIGSAIGLINNNPTASEIAKDISSGVDMIFYTSEEKAIDAAADATRRIAATEQAMTSWLKQIELTSGAEVFRSKTRRVLAVGTIFNMWCLIWMCVWAEIAASFGWFGIKVVKLTFPAGTPLIDQIELTSITWSILKVASVFELGWVFCTIIVFYFGPQLVQILKGNK